MTQESKFNNVHIKLEFGVAMHKSMIFKTTVTPPNFQHIQSCLNNTLLPYDIFLRSLTRDTRLTFKK